jgi:type-F conjugative transfer system pilin assembly protein TrbC
MLTSIVCKSIYLSRVAAGAIGLFISLSLLSVHAFADETVRVHIDTPSLCHELDRVEGNKVFLRSSGKCPAGKGKLAVEVGAEVSNVEIYDGNMFLKSQPVYKMNLNQGAVQEIHKKAKEDAKEKEIPKNKHEEFGQAKAEEMANYFYSDAYQKKISAEVERLKATVFKKQFDESTARLLKKHYSDMPAGTLPANERIYVFISSSMPLHVLRNYAADLDKLSDRNVVMVMRGFVGGITYVKPTREFVGRVLNKSEGCDPASSICETYRVNLQIDPTLFGRYKISEVPAFVYATNVNTVDVTFSEGAGDNTSVGSFSVIKGDYPLEYMLERIYEGTGSKSIDAVLAALRQGYYK